MSDLVFRTAQGLADAIRHREVSATEVLEAHLRHIDQHNPRLNAIVTLDEEQARQRAKEADAALAMGELWGPLHGVPVTVKDGFETADLRSTNSQKSLANHVPKEDATVVARLRVAGAVILGKTNLPERGGDVQTNSPLFGRANNPWDADRTTGGSTGGGAAAVAAGLSPLELGSDMGGSIRIPAHFCGVFGLKPTEHLVSVAGNINSFPPGGPRGIRHMDAPGPLARSVEDLKLCLSLIAGPDGRDLEVPLVPLAGPVERPLREYRFAWTDDFGGVPVTAETRAALEMLARKLEDLGCRVERLSPPQFDFELAWRTYGEILGTEVGVTLPPPVSFLAHLLRGFLSMMHKDEPMIRATYRGFGLSMRRYAAALTQRDALMAALEGFLAGWDAWLCPVTSGPAFTHRPTSRFRGQRIEVDDEKIPYWLATIAYPTILNLTGNPVVVLPLARSKDGLPIGVQVVGQRWRDMELLAIAERLSEVTGAFSRPPGY